MWLDGRVWDGPWTAPAAHGPLSSWPPGAGSSGLRQFASASKEAAHRVWQQRCGHKVWKKERSVQNLFIPSGVIVKMILVQVEFFHCSNVERNIVDGKYAIIS